MKRILDIVVSFMGLVLMSPVLLVFMFLVWVQDYHNPFYIAKRAGRNMIPFNMIKLRSMRINADKTGVTSTSANDNRITKVGHLIRKYKLDEFTQLINVFKGDMSLVGPRPQVINHIEECYTTEEMRLLTVRPGITDISSIVFSDEGDILRNSVDADLDYNRLIRPWKSRLGLVYVDKSNILLDLQLIWLTVKSIFNKQAVLKDINIILKNMRVDEEILQVSLRRQALYPAPPPGLKEIYNH